LEVINLQIKKKSQHKKNISNLKEITKLKKQNNNQNIHLI